VLLGGVACTSASACTAVGRYLTRSGTGLPLVERWNGRRWTIQRTPSPAGAPGSELRDVACTSATACTAVGSSTDQSGNTLATLAERWDGRRWRIEATPSGARPRGLVAVACTSASICTAVGNSGALNLAERRKRGRWNVQPTPTRVGAQSSQLNGLACASSSACTAVGNRADLTGNPLGTMAERWDGTRWSIQPTPNPAGARGSLLTAVACPSASSCIAVGFATNSPGTPAATLAERWDGTRWSVLPTPNPPGGGGSILGSVACPSITACIAVGGATDNAGNPRATLAERWDGTRWSILPTPNPPGGGGSFLDGVACPSITACIAVGNATDSSGTPTGTLAERWDGTDWSISSTPEPTGASGAELNSVACTSSTDCIAVGAPLRNHGEEAGPLAEHWNGTDWQILPIPTPPQAQGGFLSSVACTSASACTAAGLAFTTTLPFIVAERWNGTSWSIQPTADLTLAYDIDPPAVTCTSSQTCLLVSSFFNTFPNGPKLTLGERWTGASP
jgi:hypothetical protein